MVYSVLVSEAAIDWGLLLRCVSSVDRNEDAAGLFATPAGGRRRNYFEDYTWDASRRLSCSAPHYPR